MLLFSNIANFMQISSRKEQKKLLYETQRQGADRSRVTSVRFAISFGLDPHVASLLRMTGTTSLRGA